MQSTRFATMPFFCLGIELLLELLLMTFLLLWTLPCRLRGMA